MRGNKHNFKPPKKSRGEIWAKNLKHGGGLRGGPKKTTERDLWKLIIFFLPALEKNLFGICHFKKKHFPFSKKKKKIEKQKKNFKIIGGTFPGIVFPVKKNKKKIKGAGGGKRNKKGKNLTLFNNSYENKKGFVKKKPFFFRFRFFALKTAIC